MSLTRFAKTFFVTLALAAASLQAQAEPVIDQPAPTFYGKAADGGTINLAALRGKIVVLEWTNHECPFVKKHYESGNIPQLQKEAAAQGVVWLQVISSAQGKQGYVDGPAAIKLNESRGAKPAYTILDPEGKIGKLYDAQTSPHLFIINPEGVLVYKGGIDSIQSAKQEDIAKATNYVRESLAALAAGKKVPNPVTKPYGCSIKYAS
jgi:peroxiredoxin